MMKKLLALFLRPVWRMTLPLRRRAVGTLRKELLDVLGPVMHKLVRVEDDLVRTRAEIAELEQALRPLQTLETERRATDLLLKALLREITRIQMQLESPAEAAPGSNYPRTAA
jgi:hypothetical protein